MRRILPRTNAREDRFLGWSALQWGTAYAWALASGRDPFAPSRDGAHELLAAWRGSWMFDPPAKASTEAAREWAAALFTAV